LDKGFGTQGVNADTCGESHPDKPVQQRGDANAQVSSTVGNRGGLQRGALITRNAARRLSPGYDPYELQAQCQKKIKNPKTSTTFISCPAGNSSTAEILAMFNAQFWSMWLAVSPWLHVAHRIEVSLQRNLTDLPGAVRIRLSRTTCKPWLRMITTRISCERLDC